MTIEVWKLTFTAEVAVNEEWKATNTDQLYKELVRVVKQQGYLSGLMIGQSCMELTPENKDVKHR